MKSSARRIQYERAAYQDLSSANRSLSAFSNDPFWKKKQYRFSETRKIILLVNYLDAKTLLLLYICLRQLICRRLFFYQEPKGKGARLCLLLVPELQAQLAFSALPQGKIGH